MGTKPGRNDGNVFGPSKDDGAQHCEFTKCCELYTLLFKIKDSFINKEIS